METTTEKPRRRRRLVFSLRTLMIAILVVGGWLGWKVNRAKTQRRAVAMIRSAGGGVTFDFEDLLLKTPAGTKRARKPPGPDWLRRWVGDEYFREVTGVLFSVPVTTEAMKAVGTLDRLESIEIYSTLKAGDGLESLQGLRRLNRVFLNGPAVNDACLADLANCRELRVLRLTRTDVSDSGVIRLAGLSKLEDLWLTVSPKVTDASVEKVLPTLTSLKTLNLSSTGITDQAMVTVGRISSLRRLSLDYTKLTDQGIANLKDLSGLNALGLDQTGITDAGLASLAGMIDLGQLTLRQTKLTGSGFSHLDRLQKLQILGLEGSEFGDKGMPYLARLAGLKSVILGRTKVSDAGLAYLQSSPGLDSLFTWGTEVTDSGLAELQQKNPKIKQVSNQEPLPPPPMLPPPPVPQRQTRNSQIQ